MAEQSPYQPEDELQNDTEDNVLPVLLLAFITSGKLFTGDFFSFDLVNDSNSAFVKEVSKVIPSLSTASSEAVTIGLQRAMRETDLTNLTYNFGSTRFQDNVREIFQRNMDFLMNTNQNMVQRVLQIANEKGWDDQEILRRLRMYWGLTPDHVSAVVKLEESLIREGASKSVIRKTIQAKIDNLIEWRSGLTAAQVATEVVERSKAVAFAEMFEDGDIPDDYVKQSIAVLDENTTVICTTSNRTIAELNGNFPNGFFAPPFNDPVHPCRTSIRIIRRP